MAEDIKADIGTCAWHPGWNDRVRDPTVVKHMVGGNATPDQEAALDREPNARQDELRLRIRELVGDVESLGTLRRQATDLSTEFGDYGVMVAIDHATNGEWLPPAVSYKYAHFFTHWAVLAITRLADPHRR